MLVVFLEYAYERSWKLQQYRSCNKSCHQKKRIGVIGCDSDRAFPVYFKAEEEEIICSSLHRLIELRQLPTNFFVVGLRVEEATGIPNSGYRYIVFGKHGRITLRYDALRQKVSLKAVVTTSVNRPLQYCTRQANSDPILFRDDLLKVGDVVEQFADNGVALREFYEVAYKPCRKEYTRDRLFTECTPCISVGMLPINQENRISLVVVVQPTKHRCALPYSCILYG